LPTINQFVEPSEITLTNSPLLVKSIVLNTPSILLPTEHDTCTSDAPTLLIVNLVPEIEFISGKLAVAGCGLFIIINSSFSEALVCVEDDVSSLLKPFVISTPEKLAETPDKMFVAELKVRVDEPPNEPLLLNCN
jgi:hypothetical protein